MNSHECRVSKSNGKIGRFSWLMQGKIAYKITEHFKYGLSLEGNEAQNTFWLRLIFLKILMHNV